MRVGRRKNRLDFRRGEIVKKANIFGTCSRSYHLCAPGAITTKHQADAVMCEPARCGYKSIPRAGKTQIPRVQKNEGKIAANGVHYLWIGRGQRRSGGKNVRSVANDRHARGFYSLCDDPRSHVLAENDDAIGAPQRPAVKFLPDSREDAKFAAR